MPLAASPNSVLRVTTALAWLILASAPAHASCSATAAGPDQLIITTSAIATCDAGMMREALQNAVLVNEASGRARQAALLQRGTARSSRSINNALYRLGTAPGAAPPPTTFVMPGSAAR